MQRHRIILTSLCALLLLAVSGLAQQEGRPDRDPDGPRRVTARKVSPDGAIAIRASQLNGMTVKNAAGKNLGTIQDFVVDLSSNKIRYLAVSYGGFLGLGDKLFAIPPDAFELHANQEGDGHFLQLDIPEEHLKNAPGFDQNHWPDFADAKWQADVDAYYRAHRRGVNVEINVQRKDKDQEK